ncbi:MAG: hypothetical protein K6G92_07635, partial [Bacteroidaceae bacterium]|nr:hypothetical protein [Bacteroidaceae bacterium]
LGARAQVTVIYGEKGETGNPYKFSGGTIEATNQSAANGQVTITLTVTPKKNYSISKDDIKVYAVLPASVRSTRGLEISNELTLDGDDPTDLSAKRDYTVTLDQNLGLWVQSATFTLASNGGDESKGNRSSSTPLKYEQDGVQTVEAGKPYRIRTTMIEGMQLSTKKNTERPNDQAIGIFTTDYTANDQIFYFEATGDKYFIKDANGKYIWTDSGKNDWKTNAGDKVDNNQYKYAIDRVDGTDYVKFKCAGSYYLAPGRGFVDGSPVYGDGDKGRHNTNTKTMILWKIIPWDPLADFKKLIDAVATYKDNDATLSTAYATALSTAYATALSTYDTYKDTPIADMLDNTGDVLTAITSGISDLTTARDNYLRSIAMPTPGECYIAWSHDTDKLLTRPVDNGSATLTAAISANNRMTLESDGTNYYIKNGDYYLAVKGTRTVTPGDNYDNGNNVLTTEWNTTKDAACQLNLIPYGNGHFGIQFKRFHNYSTSNSTGGYLDPGPCTDLNTLYPLREDGITNPLGYWTFKMKGPSITYNPGTNTATISCSTPGATIYYAMGDADVVVSTEGEGYSGSVTTAVLDPGVTTIKAVSKSGEVELSSSLTIPFQTTAGSNERPYLLQNSNISSEVWTDGYLPFFMIPDVNNNRLNTTSIPMARMEWTFEYAGEVGRQIFYYIKNTATGHYVQYDGTNIVLNKTLDSGSDGFKFRIIPYYTSGELKGYNIALASEDKYFDKWNGNHNADAVALGTGQNGANALWHIKKKSDINRTIPFTLSDGNSAHYYKLHTRSTTDYYIVPEASAGGYVTTSNEESYSQSWYVEKAADATDDDWADYFYIRNALSGAYLYFRANPVSGNISDAFSTHSSKTEDENRYLFTFARSPYNDDWFIVPKLLKDVSYNNISSLWRDNTHALKTQPTRNNGNAMWFFEQSSFKCATPVFVYDNLQDMFSISCATPGAKIYYKGYNDGVAVPTFSFPGDRGTLYTGVPFEKVFDNYVAVAARCIDDDSDMSDVATGNASSMLYRYHIIDKSHTDLLQIGSNDETLGLPEAYRSPLVTRYHYFTAAHFNTTDNMPTGAEMTNLSDLGGGQDIYVTYDVSARIKLDGSQYYMLRYENPAGTELWEEVSDLPQGFPLNQKNKVYYPYTNGKEGFNLYGDEKKAAAFDDGESTRTRYLWYFEGDDPYHVKIRSFNTAGSSKYHLLDGPYASYFYTFYGNGGSTDTGHTDAAVHTVLTQTDRGDLTPEAPSDDLEPTEYMILNGHGGSSSSFPYRLLTTAKDGTTNKHLEVTTFEHQWLNSKKTAADALNGSRTANWYHMPDLETSFTKTHADHTDIYYETVAMGSDFQIELVMLYP